MGGNIVASDGASLLGQIASRRKPSWGKTIAVGAFGVVPAVVYRTLGSRDSTDAFLLEFSQVHGSTVVVGTGAGDGFAFVCSIVEFLDGEAGIAAFGSASQRWGNRPRTTPDELWTALYDNDPDFQRSLDDVEALLAEAGLTPAALSAEQIDAIATAGWATARDPVPRETVLALVADLEP